MKKLIEYYRNRIEQGKEYRAIYDMLTNPPAEHLLWMCLEWSDEMAHTSDTYKEFSRQLRQQLQAMRER
jgi:hypothetical protein